MTARIATVADVRPHGDNLTIVRVQDGADIREVVAGLDNGLPRWEKDEIVVYVAEGSLVPEDVLRERNYWNDTKGKGELEGNRGNRVKMRRMVGFDSRGLLFKTRRGSFMGVPIVFVDRKANGGGDAPRTDPDTGLPLAVALGVNVGDDVSAHLGITEHGA